MIRYAHFLLPLLLATIAGLVQYKQWFSFLDLAIYDSLQFVNPLPARDDIVIIAIDEESLSHLGRWPWSRKIHAELIEKLTLAEVKVIGLDILFSESSQSEPQSDTLLYEAMRMSKRVVLPVYFESVRDRGQLIEVPPIARFTKVTAGLGHAHIECSDDGICRSVYLKEGIGGPHWPHFALAVYNFIDESRSKKGADSKSASSEFSLDTKIPGVRAEIRSEYSPMHIYRDYYNLIPFEEKKPPTVISYFDVLTDKVPLNLLKDKIVFVGATATGIHDMMATPMGSVAGIKINTLIFQALEARSMVYVPSPLGTSALFFILIFVLLSLFSFLSPARLFISIILSAGASIAVSAILLAYWKLWLAPVTFAIFLLSFYPLWSWLRLEFALGFLHRSLVRLQSESAGDASRSILPAYERLGDILYGAENNEVPAFRGTEIVSRTIEQFIQANRGLETARQLVLQSMSKLQEAVLIFNSAGELILKNNLAHDLFPNLSLSESILNLSNTLVLSGDKDWTSYVEELKIYDSEVFIEGGLISSNSTDNEGQVDLYIQGRNIVISRFRKRSRNNYTQIVLLTFTDVSELKKSERSRMETLNFISHDLRSPLVSILALIRNARNNDYVERDKTLFDEIEAYTNRNLSFAESLLQLSRAESTNVASYVLCDMHAIVDEAYSQARALSMAKSIELSIQREREDMWVLANADLLERAIVNLLSNAIKYSPANTAVTMSLYTQQSELTVEGNQRLVCVAVADQGDGILNDEKDKIFQKYNRGSRRRKEVGAGLGLYFVKVVAQRHQGDVSLHSNTHGGATFILTLPLAEN